MIPYPIYPQQMNPIDNPCAPVYNPCQDPCYPGPQALGYPNMFAQGPYPPVQGAYMPMAQPLPYPEVREVICQPSIIHIRKCTVPISSTPQDLKGKGKLYASPASSISGNA